MLQSSNLHIPDVKDRYLNWPKVDLSYKIRGRTYSDYVALMAEYRNYLYKNASLNGWFYSSDYFGTQYDDNELPGKPHIIFYFKDKNDALMFRIKFS